MTAMRWGDELWDGFDRLSKYFNEGIQFYEQYEEFLKERCVIENAYAKSLRKLIKNYEYTKKSLSSTLPITYNIITSSSSSSSSSSMQTGKMHKQNSMISNSGISASFNVDDTCKLTYLKCFNRNLNEIKDMACQHELVAENLQKRVLDKLIAEIKNFKDERKKCIDDKEKFLSTHQSYEESLRKSKSKYECAFREAEKAKENLQKVEQDDNSSRIDIRKQQTIYEQKLRMCDQHKADYANQLCSANCIKTKYYDEQLPASVNALQILEEKRIKQFKEFTDECVAVEMEVIPRIERCHKGMQVAVNEISAENDIECVVNALKTGYAKPANHVFEDLSNPSQQSSTPTNTSNVSLNEQQSFDSTSSVRASKFKTISRLRGLLKPKTEMETLYDLPPQQQKKELQKKMDTINADIAKEYKEREGLIKLKDIYQNNEKLGNTESVLTALKNNDDKLASLNALLNKYKLLYDDCERNGTLSKAKTLPNQNRNNSFSSQSAYQTSPQDNTDSSSSSPTTPISKHKNTNPLNSSLTIQEQTNDNVVHERKNTSVESFDDGADENSNGFMDDAATRRLNDNRTTSSALAFIESQYEQLEIHDEMNNKMPMIANLDESSSSQNAFDNDEQHHIIGKAYVLYDFKGTVQNSISITEDEWLGVLEKDSGDGWTLVVKNTVNREKGYVPTDYCRIEYF